MWRLIGLPRCVGHHRGRTLLGHHCADSGPWQQQQQQAVQHLASKSEAASPPLDSPLLRPELGLVAGGYDNVMFPPDRVRNFSIIAHVDHGKSTLADKLMAMTGAIPKGSQAQYLDRLQVERDRGITVKAQTASLVYRHLGKDYLLNLVDTPGHVDFSYEVSRSLAACQGALLLVDASQGIQAQTVANHRLSTEQGLDLVALVNKVDLPSADPDRVEAQMEQVLGIDPATVLRASAKTGLGLDLVLPAIVGRVSPPQGSPDAPLRLLLFDAYHDDYRGVICLCAVVDGTVHKGDRVCAMATGEEYDVLDVGILAPEPHSLQRLTTGRVGYIVTGMKNMKHARVGDTWHRTKEPVEALPGFQKAQCMVFAGLYPLSGEEIEALSVAMDKLSLNDASVMIKKENSDALGPGFRCGFLGMLHLDVFMERLQQEYGAAVVTTTPTVPYTLHMADGGTQTMNRSSDFPLDGPKISSIWEPTVAATVLVPVEYVGRVMELCQLRRGELLEHSVVGTDGERALLRYSLPLSELAGDFYSQLKSRTQGYASFDYEEGEPRPADLVRLDILAGGKAIDALCRMVHRGDADQVGRAILSKMAELIDRQQFDVALQAAVNGKVIARETLRALRKNVLAKCYGGDITRKRKLLDKQKVGKQRLKRLGCIDVPQDVFPELMRAR